jgi:hypothetical protein
MVRTSSFLSAAALVLTATACRETSDHHTEARYDLQELVVYTQLNTDSSARPGFLRHLYGTTWRAQVRTMRRPFCVDFDAAQLLRPGTPLNLREAPCSYLRQA